MVRAMQKLNDLSKTLDKEKNIFNWINSWMRMNWPMLEVDWKSYS